MKQSCERFRPRSRPALCFALVFVLSNVLFTSQRLGLRRLAGVSIGSQEGRAKKPDNSTDSAANEATRWTRMHSTTGPQDTVRNKERTQLKASTNPECPVAARKARGVFQSAAHDGDFANVVLLTSSNIGYYDILQNWEYMAAQQGLKWAVLSMDEALYDRLGPERAVRSDGRFGVSDAVTFMTPGFNVLSCNKLRLALSVVEFCDVDVVFSDADNVFFGNPFEHELGRLIKSKRYEYIYQPDGFGGHKRPRKHRCLRSGQLAKEGNTGFYYLSRKSSFIKQLIRNTLESCMRSKDNDGRNDDQKLFWNELNNELRQPKFLSNKTLHHCDAREVDDEQVEERVPAPDTFSVCCLDPYHYPIGLYLPPPSQNLTTFHANWCTGKASKIDKLKRARSDGYGWNEGRINYSYLNITK